MKFKSKVAINSCRFTRKLVRLVGKGGTAFPGTVAMKFNPEVLKDVSKGVRTVLVTGTNGKTTTTLMIAEGLEKAGYSVFSNRSGANMTSGITTEFIMNFKHGEPEKKFAVIECDEAYVRHVAPLLNPEAIVVTSLFQDQMDRMGDVDSVMNIIKKGTDASDATLCLNGDCNLVASLGENKKAVYFGFETALPYKEEETDSTPFHCVKCGEKMEYDYHTYAHLGAFRCPSCGYKRPALDVAVTDCSFRIDSSLLTVRSGNEKYHVKVALPAAYNAYNAIAAMSVFKALSIPYDGLFEALENMSSAFGRMERFVYDGNDLQMILVKNPVGYNQALGFVSEMDPDITLALLLNNRESDGTDISWLKDVDFEKFVEEHPSAEIIVGGECRDDLEKRLREAGAENIINLDSFEKVAEKIEEKGKPAVILPNYTCMIDMRELLAGKTGEKSYWE